MPALEAVGVKSDILKVTNIGFMLLAMGVYFFKIPNGFTTGGVSGISTILAQITSISAGVWIWILNFGLMVLGFIFLGKQNGIKTVYCSMFYSAVTYFLEVVIPIKKPLTDQPFLELVYAMLLTSIGSAIIFNCDASSGGTDIAALILKKYTSVDVGKALLIVDFIVAAGAFVVFDIKMLHHGATITSATGKFTGEEKTMIHTVCKRFEPIKLRNRIKEIDPHAFIIITTSSEIIGRGFKSV